MDFIDIITITDTALLCFLLFTYIFFLLIIAIPDSALLAVPDPALLCFVYVFVYMYCLPIYFILIVARF